MAKSIVAGDLNRIIEMAWEDRTPFEAIEYQFNLKENDVRKIMRSHLSRSSFIMWRKRVAGRKTKHQSTSKSTRFKSKIKNRIIVMHRVLFVCTANIFRSRFSEEVHNHFCWES